MLKQLFVYIRPYKLYIVLSCCCGMFEALLELMLPLVMSRIVDVGIVGRNSAYIIKMGALMVIIALVSLMFGVGMAIFSSIVGQGFGSKLRQAQYEKIQDYSFKNIEKFSTASLITRLTNDVNAIQMAVTMGLRLLVRAPMMLIFALVLAIIINARLAVVFTVSIPVLVAAVWWIIKKVGPRFTLLQQKLDRINVVVQENLVGIRLVKSFVRGDFEREKFEESNDQLMQAAERAFGFVVLNMPIMQLVIFSSIIAIIWFGGNMVYAGTFQVGKLVSFITYVIQILISLMMISMILMMLSRSVASAKRILEVLEEEPDIVDPEINDYPVENGAVEFDHVNFKYDSASSEYNLKDITFQVKSGQTLGIIGGTGSGKTTLVQLIPRLYEVNQGRVLVGGRDVRQYKLETLRNAVAIVLQKNTLFSGTIEENLKWGDAVATRQQLEKAAAIGAVDEFIQRFPKGYETNLSQGGVNLSGGQKQRLSIARAILKQPKILILDDSTSAVDMATDVRIRKALRSELQATTKIIIAQRIASIFDADQIIVLDDGKISAIGNHQQLMNTSEIYQDIYRSQQEGADLNG